MKEVNAYLNFDGQTKAAMEFYQSCLGGELHMMPFPKEMGPSDRTMHAQLEKNGTSILMASDTPPGMPLHPGNNISVSIQCESVDEINRLFPALAEGGQVRMPLDNTFWGARFGMLTDKFGIQWMLNCQLEGAQQ